MKTLKITAIALVALALVLVVFTAGLMQSVKYLLECNDRKGYPVIWDQPSTHQMAEITAQNKGWYAQNLAQYGVTNVTDTVFPTGAPRCRPCSLARSMLHMSGQPRCFPPHQHRP